MACDGIVDAPASTRANVGIAIGSGTDNTIESADITLFKAIRLSRATFRKIQ